MTKPLPWPEHALPELDRCIEIAEEMVALLDKQGQALNAGRTQEVARITIRVYYLAHEIKELLRYARRKENLLPEQS